MLKIFLNRHLHLILEGFNVWILKKRFECWKYFWIDICCCMTSRVILLTLATAWHPCRYIAGYQNVHIQLVLIDDIGQNFIQCLTIGLQLFWPTIVFLMIFVVIFDSTNAERGLVKLDAFLSSVAALCLSALLVASI